MIAKTIAAVPPILTELAAKISRPLCEVCPNYAYLLATSDVCLM